MITAGRMAAQTAVLVFAAMGSKALSAPKGALPTTLDDYFLLGTQPDQSSGKEFDPIVPSAHNCIFCHEVSEPQEVPIYTRWQGSMMAHSARDPLFQACLAITNQDAAFSGDLCLRCHAPSAWLAGRSEPTDGSALIKDDFEGVTCNFCHRLVDPVLRVGINPREDRPILTALSEAGLLPMQPGGASYVVDPNDSRRGPFRPCVNVEDCNPGDVPLNMHGVPIYYSPFHKRSELCGTCHEVSNPAFVRQSDGSFALDTLGVSHPTQNPYDMFPHDRTFSEWANSEYAKVGVDAGGVFGGNHSTGIMRTCQDCHMPATIAMGCAFDEPFFERPNVPAHNFNGGNTWMPAVLAFLYPEELSIDYLQAGILRARYMLENAATVQAEPADCAVRVRVVNETGHKLPTGYTEGRRMWIEVAFKDGSLQTVAVRGAYDPTTAELTEENTKIYEAKFGLDGEMAKRTGKPEGPSFHFALSNRIYKDNRIPPRGFENSAFAAAGAAPVGAVYADGQYWDDTVFRIPAGATSARVRLYYQTASKEYITFLRDENRTNNAGSDLFWAWEMTGKSPPVLMREVSLTGLAAGRFADADCDEDVDGADYAQMAPCIGGAGQEVELGCESFDGESDGDVDLLDTARLQNEYTGQL